MARSKYSWQIRPARYLLRLAVLLLLCSTLSVTTAPFASPLSTALIASAAGGTQPTILAGAALHALAGSKIFWGTSSDSTCSGEIIHTEGVLSLNRIATYGSPIRQLFLRQPVECEGTKAFGPLVADDQYVYWSGDGLYRLSTNANVGDQPELVTAQIPAQELAIDTNSVYGIVHGIGSSVIKRFAKLDGAVTTLTTVSGDASHPSSDGENVYWMVAGKLMKYELRSGQTSTVASGVTGYDAPGPLKNCNTVCIISNEVYVAQGHTVVRYLNGSGTSSQPLYTAPFDNIYSLVTAGNDLFLFDLRPVTCPGFCDDRQALLTKLPVFGGQSAVIATERFRAVLDSDLDVPLMTDGASLFWNGDGGVRHLPTSAGAIAQPDDIVNYGMEVTQGVQRIDNSVPLFEDRRTFVRVYAKSNTSLPGVTASLYNTQFPNAPLKMINRSSINSSPLQSITVSPYLYRSDINNSFLFELPLSWTHGPLQLRAIINPYQWPLETNYDNNIRVQSFTFQPSTRLETWFFRFAYDLNGTHYAASEQSVNAISDWTRRLYPLASTPGTYQDPSPGFRPRSVEVALPVLSQLVQDYFPAPFGSNFCEWLKDPNLCTTILVNDYLAEVRLGSLFTASPFPDNATLYGVIPQPPTNCQATNPCVRGSTPGDTSAKASSGTDSNPETFTHETGHVLGRQHPWKGSVDDPQGTCGNTTDDGPMDLYYPYTDGHIGPDNPFEVDTQGGSVLEGFDSGTLTIKPGHDWYDVMSYCSPRWISDNNYIAIYNAIDGHPLGAANARLATENADSLAVFGFIVPDTGKAALLNLRRMQSNSLSQPNARGIYAVQLLNAQGAVLLNHPFTPAPLQSHSPGVVLDVSEVVPFVAGAAQVRIVQVGNGRLLASQPISAHPPSISDVALRNAPSPIVGNVTLGWSASDPDGDNLTFDIFYSHDDGASFMPLQLGVAGTSAQIDSSKLGGGSGVFRVIASDGVHTALADSTPATVANKPPQPLIINPGQGTRIHWGTLINFMGDATDLQDGGVSGTKLVWSDAKGTVLGTGAVLTRDDLPVGANNITLTATNSAGLSASASVAVIVDDDLDLPGPTLSIGPTQIGWQVAPGTTQSQTAKLGINNVGGGSLVWTASSDASWLSLSATSGSAPTELTLTAHPPAVADGTLLSTQIVLKATGGTGSPQTIIVPVTLAVGNVEEARGGGQTTWRVFLPIVRR